MRPGFSLSNVFQLAVCVATGLLFPSLLQAQLIAGHSNVPVVLVNGWQWNCAFSDVAENFGQLQTFLAQDSPGSPVPLYFDNCSQGNISIDQLGARFGQFLQSHGPGPVDVVAHSMGGLFVRAYLAGLNLQSNTVTPPLTTGIRKLILIGTPNFGTYVPDPLSQVQVPEMQYGSSLLWDLATWNQWGDDLRGIDSVAIAGNATAHAGQPSDGFITVASASIAFASPDGDQRTRVIPYCHVNALATELIFCQGAGIAYIDSRAHPSYQIIRSFLDGSDTWQSVGIPASQAAQSGGLLFGVFDKNNQPLSVTNPFFVEPLLGSSVSVPFQLGPPAWYLTGIPAGNFSAGFDLQGQRYNLSNVAVPSGSFGLEKAKFGPLILRGGVASSAGISPGARSVATGSLISIFGRNLASSTANAPYPWPAQLADTTVTIGGQPARLNYVADGQVNALAPNLPPGLYTLVASNSQGSDSVNVMIEASVPTLFALAGNTAAALHSDYEVISATNPVSVGETISLFATGLGAVTLIHGLELANTIPMVSVDGQSAAVLFAGRAPGFDGLDQINIQIPAGVRRGVAVPVTVTSGDRTSNQVLLAVN